jgi:hypothetical protein
MSRKNMRMFSALLLKTAVPSSYCYEYTVLNSGLLITISAIIAAISIEIATHLLVEGFTAVFQSLVSDEGGCNG